MTGKDACPTIQTMTSEFDQARSIAERIARRVSLASPSAPNQSSSSINLTSELAAMRASLGELEHRLTQIESKVRSETGIESTSREMQQPPIRLRTHSPWLSGVNAGVIHPSQEKFGVEEATVSELVDFFQNEKRCTLEPGGKPCDHCAMCSSRGF